jgi:anti-sigma factor ChrR (cupin superfamily)
MANKTGELADMAAGRLQMAKDEILAAGDAETLAWALDRFREAEALLRRILGDQAPSGESAAGSEAA